ncbi:BolA-like protein [Nesidiocoris tenuis]|uniref:BolA-like protein n=1 Tax=Nesidiocoris tenuis TaxID=355587 RepID=A0ABN7AND2_9HEMI|nr:BolA-like protein [Nesidiocoris tenuis]
MSSSLLLNLIKKARNLINIPIQPAPTLISSVYKRFLCSQSNAEEKLKSILKTSFPEAKSVEVVDVSGGCGAMYEIYVEAPQFKGLSIVKQHRLVTNALKEEIKDMHGLRIQTSPA